MVKPEAEPTNMICESYQIAFIMRRLIVKYRSPIRITGYWSCTVPFLGCTHVTSPSFLSRKGSICRLHGGCWYGHDSPLCTRSTVSMSTDFISRKLELEDY
jgi:hypothetical protein